MKHPTFRATSVAAVFMTCALFVSACNSNNSTPSAPTDVAGEYSGTVQDAVYGKGTVTGTLAQQGKNVTGNVTLTYGGTAIDGTVAWTLASNNALSGTITTTTPSCTYNVTASYNTSTNQIPGSYTGSTGCSGNGTFTLVEQCSDPITPAAITPASGVRPC